MTPDRPAVLAASREATPPASSDSSRRVVGVAVAGVAVVLAAWTAAWTLAAFWDDRARSLLYRDGRGGGRAADLERAGRLADLAVALNPLDANYRRTRALVAGARSTPGAAGEPTAGDDAARAVPAHEEVVARRPAWGRGWAELALARQAAGQPAQRVLASLRRAIYFAPREPFVRRTALRLGAAFLDALAPDDRDAVRWVATYTLQHDVRMLREVAGDAAVAARLRTLLAGTGQAAALDAALGHRR